MTATVQVRDARPEDEARWRELWRGYLTFYKADIPESVTAHTWARCLDPASPLSARLAEVEGRIEGFALHHTHLSTWGEKPDCYLEDLFVDPETRGAGVGRALLDDLVALCPERGWGRLYWHTDEGNARARRLYDSYAPADGHVRYRLRY